MIIENKAQCNKCKDIVQSNHRHDFRTCKCGNLSVDGGKCYLRRTFKSRNDWTELSTETDGEGTA